jgi:hypothetical protein
MLLNGSVDRLLVVDTIADASPNFPIDLHQERGHLRRVLLTAFRHRRRDNLTLVIDTEVQFLPALDFFLAVFLCVPFALTADLQTATVHDEVDRPYGRTMNLSLDRHRGIATRQGGMIGTRQRQAH